MTWFQFLRNKLWFSSISVDYSKCQTNSKVIVSKLSVLTFGSWTKYRTFMLFSWNLQHHLQVDLNIFPNLSKKLSVMVQCHEHLTCFTPKNLKSLESSVTLVWSSMSLDHRSSPPADYHSSSICHYSSRRNLTLIKRPISNLSWQTGHKELLELTRGIKTHSALQLVVR